MARDAQQHRMMVTPHATTNLLSRMVGQLQQFICGLHGHDALLHFEQGRISLQCTSCGYETPGWDVKGVPARVEARQPASHITRLSLIGERRVA